MHLTQVGAIGSMSPNGGLSANAARFEARLSTKAGRRDYLFQLRWPDGFRCPRCGGSHAWTIRATLLQCAGCDHQTSVAAGTLPQDTRKPLIIWLFRRL